MKNIIFFLFLICSIGCGSDKPQKHKEAFKIPAIPSIDEQDELEELNEFDEFEELLLESLIFNDFGPV